jgi:hypothetical protein
LLRLPGFLAFPVVKKKCHQPKRLHTITLVLKLEVGSSFLQVAYCEHCSKSSLLYLKPVTPPCSRTSGPAYEAGSNFPVDKEERT